MSICHDEEFKHGICYKLVHTKHFHFSFFIFYFQGGGRGHKSKMNQLQGKKYNHLKRKPRKTEGLKK